MAYNQPYSNQRITHRPRITRSVLGTCVHFFKSIWRLRYRAYALIVLLALVPFLHSSTANIRSEVDLKAYGYATLNNNLLFSSVEKDTLSKLSFGSQVLLTSKKFNYFGSNESKMRSENLQYQLSQAGLSAEEQVRLSKAAPLDQLIACPKNPQSINLLRYPQYNISTPIINSELTDLFNTKPDGSIDYQKPIEEDISKGPLSNPIQRLLVNGIVHIAFTADPGEIGNSYIVGHSSNYASVPSDYNTIFKPLESISKPGEEFVIWDTCGRELNFKVFETVRIAEEDVNEAYKIYPDKRVVTLQTSILTYVPSKGGLYPSHRWLTRGELVLD
jgi:Sortase domain